MTGFSPRNSVLAVLTLAFCLAGLGGCDVMGKGTQKAMYTLPQKSRILVMVDARPNSGMPADAVVALGDALNNYLYKHKLADAFVGQTRLIEIRKRDAARELGVATIARQSEADVVVYLDVLQFTIDTSTDGQLTRGYAQVGIKVIDRNGKRMFPNEVEPLGLIVEANIEPAMIESSPTSRVKDQLVDLLAVRTGRIFHDYDREDREIAR